jgi:hypothetical protein
MPVSVEGLQAIANLNSTINKNSQDNLDYTSRRAQAQKASDLMRQGDTKGAYSILMQDPDFAAKNGPAVAQIIPEFAQKLKQSTETGDQQAKTDFGTNEAQIQLLKNKGALDTSQVKASKGTVKADPESPTGFSLTTPSGIFPFDAYGSPATKPGQPKPPVGTAADQTQDPNALNPKIDPNALPQNIAPNHRKAINSAVDALDKNPEIKDMNTEINGLKQADDLAAGNLPNSQIPLTMKFLESSEFVKRFNEAEFKQGPAEAQAVVDKVKNAVANKTLGNLDPGVMTNFRDIISVMQHSTLNQYEGKLHSLSGGVQSKTNGKITADQAFNALVPASNDIFKQKAAIFSKLSPQDQEAVKWARQNLGDPKARAILQHNGL